ncbi:ATP-binding protein, partial [Thermodesulfobacteriota bacterium]
VETHLRGDQVQFQVQDDGVGIPRKNVEKMFEPFWTTKNNRDGMGLAVSLGILRRHKGTISVTSQERRGSVIAVNFPLAKSASEADEQTARKMVDFNFRILLIDDDAAVKTLEAGMKAVGQITHIARSGHEGLKKFQEAEVDAVVCALSLPDMEGWQIGQSIREICMESGIPKPPIIALSEPGAQATADPITGNPDIERIVEKPVTATRLMQTVAEEVKAAVTDPDFSGKVHGIDILEYVQLTLFMGQRMVLEIQSRDGNRGFLFVDKGEIRHAVCGELEGEDALYRCLAFKGGHFASLPWREPQRTTIHRSGEYLLLEAARRRDEMGRGGHNDVS